ncbi:MAG TPA: hypothetical protein VGG31_05500 [Candidatus Dormibacteraeota bacterium]
MVVRLVAGAFAGAFGFGFALVVVVAARGFLAAGLSAGFGGVRVARATGLGWSSAGADATGSGAAAGAATESSCAVAGPMVLDRVRWHVSQVIVLRIRSPITWSSRRRLRARLQKGQ